MRQRSNLDPTREGCNTEEQLEDYLHRVQAGLPVLNTRFDPLAIAQGPARGRGGTRQSSGKSGATSPHPAVPNFIGNPSGIVESCQPSAISAGSGEYPKRSGADVSTSWQGKNRGIPTLPRTHFQETLDKLDEWITTAKIPNWQLI